MNNSTNYISSEGTKISDVEDIVGSQDRSQNALIPRTKEVFYNIYALYKETDPLKRPAIRKVEPTRMVRLIIKELNENVLPCLLINTNDIESLQTLVYCSAITTSMLIGKNVELNQNNGQEQSRIDSDPSWVKQLNKKISKLRVDISIIRQYLKTTNSNKKTKRIICAILKKNSMLCRNENIREDVERIFEDLKQKLLVQNQKRQEYNMSKLEEMRKRMEFSTSLKQISENSNTQGPVERIQENYPISEDIQFIKEEELNRQKIPKMHCSEITIPQITTALGMKAHNWGKPGPDGIQNFWYKNLTCIHQKMAELFTKCLQNPNLFPAHLAQSVIYITPLTKAGKASKRQPIPLLNTIYKIMQACISNRTQPTHDSTIEVVETTAQTVQPIQVSDSQNFTLTEPRCQQSVDLPTSSMNDTLSEVLSSSDALAHLPSFEEATP